MPIATDRAQSKKGTVYEDWNDKDTVLLVDLQAALGNRWAQIAAHFPGRSVNSVRNRFYRIQIGAQKSLDPNVKGNICNKCGLRKRGHLCSLRKHIDLTPKAPVFPFPDTLLVDYTLVDKWLSEVKFNTGV
jgi:hypothetical protein